MATDPVSTRSAPRFPPLPGSLAAAAAWPMYRQFLRSHHESDLPYSREEMRSVEYSALVPASCLADIEAKARTLIQMVVSDCLETSVTDAIGSEVPPVTDDLEWDEKVALSLLADIVRLNREAGR